MAKKITKEEYENKKKKEKHDTKTRDTLKIVSIVLNIVLLLFLIITIVISIIINNNLKKENNSLYDEINSKTETIDTLESRLNYITNGKGPYETKQKLDFLDNNVVFVMEGYGNYYYTYDCMMKKVGNREYTYWAFNLEYAKSQGYKKGGC